MLSYTIQSNLMRSAMLSKFTCDSSMLPALKLIQLSVKTENQYEPIANLVLLSVFAGVLPQYLLVNRKQSVVLPRAFLNGVILKTQLLQHLLPVVNRLADKVTAVNYNSASHKLTFSFKASDMLPAEMRKFGKLIGSEFGMLTCEISFVTTIRKAS